MSHAELEPSLRERQKRETHAVIAHAAEILFAARGFQAVTVEEVARAAGVSRQTVFNHFPNKEDLVFDRAPEAEALMVAAVRTGIAGAGLVASFREMTRLFWSRREALPDPRPRGGFFDLVDASPALQAYARDASSRATARVAETIADDIQADGDDLRPHAVAAALTSVYDAIFAAAQRRIVAGEHPRRFLPGLLDQSDRAYDLLEAGIGRYPRTSKRAKRAGNRA